MVINLKASVPPLSFTALQEVRERLESEGLTEDEVKEILTDYIPTFKGREVHLLENNGRMTPVSLFFSPVSQTFSLRWIPGYNFFLGHLEGELILPKSVSPLKKLFVKLYPGNSIEGALKVLGKEINKALTENTIELITQKIWEFPTKLELVRSLVTEAWESDGPYLTNLNAKLHGDLEGEFFNKMDGPVFGGYLPF